MVHGLVLALGVVIVAAVGGAGCTVLLETDTNPYKCKKDADCAMYANAQCDNLHKKCVPRLPFVVTDASLPPDAGGGDDGGSALTCDLAFDNGRITMGGTDGALRPLPEVP